MSKEQAPTAGGKDIDRIIEAGGDPNADVTPEKAEQRQLAALSMKVAGASWSSIAKVLEFSSATHARTAVESALAAAANSAETLEQARKLVGMRLDRLLSVAMPKAMDIKDPQQLAWHGRALAVVDRQAKVYGVDAPTQVVVTAADSEIQAIANRFARLAGISNDEQEEDIIDVEYERADDNRG